ncbi:hypothetical protein PR202_gb13107 [Eleusine coracana subsp. coracana]|uniref:Serpin domain-containing protein n=1 Tax=Eleusine coracana subsp. coracana TaxID=191504 RepID=A0AAV5ESA2_ELECO|nr:hypothetical protein PR202_gb13107 [Eleusine coracana subsp. coracana]
MAWPPPPTQPGTARRPSPSTSLLRLNAAAAAENVAFSPVSVHAALAQLLAFLGAPSAKELTDFGRIVTHRVLADRSGLGDSSGELADAFRDLVQVESYESDSDVESYYSDVECDELVARRFTEKVAFSGPRILFGGGIWVDASRVELTDAFRKVATESYKSEARTVSFTKEREEAVKMINQWVKKATENLIDTIISPDAMDDETDLVLANAVYFKGEWLRPFRYCLTRRDTFHRLDGSCRKEVESGPGKPSRGHSTTDEATQYSMFIFLPDKKDGIATMVDMVTAAPAFMYGILDEMNKKYVYVKLPKFKITFNWEQLGDALNQLGLTLPFSPEAADLAACTRKKRTVGIMARGDCSP